MNEFRSGGHTAKETFGMRVARGGENDVACRAVFFDAIAVGVSRRQQGKTAVADTDMLVMRASAANLGVL